MKTFSKKQVVLACAMALGYMSAVGAQTLRTPTAEDSMLLTDSGGQRVMSQFGDCWHAGQAPRAESSAQCDPNYREPVAARAAPAPAPYVAPVQAPVVVAAIAPQPVYEKVTFDADALFDFDKAVLRPAGRETLDDFVKRIQGINSLTISAVGHTDRLGSATYNQRLSNERAAAVKAYLESKGVQSSSIQATGVGETQPLAKTMQCKGSKGPKLISCLQPDRRVEIAVSGSKLK